MVESTQTVDNKAMREMLKLAQGSPSLLKLLYKLYQANPEADMMSKVKIRALREVVPKKSSEESVAPCSTPNVRARIMKEEKHGRFNDIGFSQAIIKPSLLTTMTKSKR